MVADVKFMIPGHDALVMSAFHPTIPNVVKIQ